MVLSVREARARLARILDQCETVDLQTFAIMVELREHGVFPDFHGCRGLIEIQLHGIVGQGRDLAGATTAWRRAARTALGGYDAPDFGPGPRRAAQLDWAQDTILRPDAPDAVLRSAARILLALSPEPLYRNAATGILRAIDAAAQARTCFIAREAAR